MAMTDIKKVLFTACQTGDLEGVKQLINGENVNSTTDISGRGSSPLHFASGFGRKPIVEYLLECGAKIHLKDGGGLIALHNACSFGHSEVAHLLLCRGSNPNAHDNWGFTPLHEAAVKGRSEVCIILLQNGADPAIKNNDGKIPYKVATGFAKQVLSGDYKKDDMLDASKTGDLVKLNQVLTPLNVNCHAHDGRRSTPLHLASGYNKFGVVQALLAQGADVHAKDKGGLVPLHNACSYGHVDVAEALIKAGANVNAMDLWHFTPLHEASSKGREEVCTLLLANGADIKIKNCQGKTPEDIASSDQLKEKLNNEFKGHKLLAAAKQAELATIKALISENSKSILKFQHPFDGNQVLHLASASMFGKRRQVTEFLVENGVDLNPRNSDHSTPLHLASKLGHTDVVDILLKSGANPNCVDITGNTALHFACQRGCVQIVRLLLSSSADGHVSNVAGYTPAQLASGIIASLLSNTRQTPIETPTSTSRKDHSQSCKSTTPLLKGSDADAKLLEAAKVGDIETVKALLDCDPSAVNTRDLEGRHSTPLHFAAGFNRIAIVKLLLERGADCHARDKGGLVPLHNACSYGHVEVCELLIEAGASVNAADLWRYTPLHEAAAKCKFDICKLLLRHGADKSRKNRDGRLPIDLVLRHGGTAAHASSGDSVESPWSDVYDLLRGDVAVLEAARKNQLNKIQKLLTPDSVNCRDEAGRQSTPLHLAAGYNSLAVATYLLENGAEVNAHDKGGLIPLHNASSYGHLDVAQLLIQYGADVLRADKWGFTPLHESAQKGRTQLCSLLLAHGADAAVRNLEGHTPLDQATADDVKCLLRESLADHSNLPVIPVAPSSPTTTPTASTPSTLVSGGDPDDDDSSSIASTDRPITCEPKGEASKQPTIVVPPMKSSKSLPDVKEQSGGNPSKDDDASLLPTSPRQIVPTSVTEILRAIQLDSMVDVFAREAITMDVLVEMGHEELKHIGVTAYGHRHKILRWTRRVVGANGDSSTLTSAAMTTLASVSRVQDGGDNDNQLSFDSDDDDDDADFADCNESTTTTKDISLKSSPAGIESPHLGGVKVISKKPANRKGSSPLSPGAQKRSFASCTTPIQLASALDNTTTLFDLPATSTQFVEIENLMQSTIRSHKDAAIGGGGLYSRFHVMAIQKLENPRLKLRYLQRNREMADEMSEAGLGPSPQGSPPAVSNKPTIDPSIPLAKLLGPNSQANEKLLFHGSPFIASIVNRGFDERHSHLAGMFGAGIYFAEHSSKSNQYVYGVGGGTGCSPHREKSCFTCTRQLLVCRVSLGKPFYQFSAMRMAHSPPGHHSVVGRPSTDGLKYPEFVIYRGEQAYPDFLVTYKLVPPDQD